MPNDETPTSHTPRQIEILGKLLDALHVSVTERAELPRGRADFEGLVLAAAVRLTRSGWLPSHARPDTVEGVLIELRDGEHWIHERHEIGLGRFSVVRSRRAALVDAVRDYVLAHGGASIDGVPIDGLPR